MGVKVDSNLENFFTNSRITQPIYHHVGRQSLGPIEISHIPDNSYFLSSLLQFLWDWFRKVLNSFLFSPEQYSSTLLGVGVNTMRLC